MRSIVSCWCPRRDSVKRQGIVLSVLEVQTVRLNYGSGVNDIETSSTKMCKRGSGEAGIAGRRYAGSSLRRWRG